jgi:hypothetical protein
MRFGTNLLTELPLTDVNALNAYIFMAMGSAMGLLPHVFPSWIAPNGDDASSARVIWLYVMATTQVAVGLGFVIQAQVIPFATRLMSADSAAAAGSLALPKAPVVSGR